MIPGTARLGPEGVTYLDLLGEGGEAFAATDVDHQVSVTMDVRVRFGVKFLGKCRRVGRKTCDNVRGTSRGTNHVLVRLQASNTLTQCIANQEHLTFSLAVSVSDVAEGKTYAPVTANDKKCRYLFGKIKVTEYAQSYFNGNKKIHALRGQKLIAELENKLGASLGSTVKIPVTTNGQPRPCPPDRRSLDERAKRCTKKKTCPKGFNRIGNQDRCSRYFGLRRPNCRTYGPNVTLYSRKISRWTLYYCIAPMV